MYLNDKICLFSYDVSCLSIRDRFILLAKLNKHWNKSNKYDSLADLAESWVKQRDLPVYDTINVYAHFLFSGAPLESTSFWVSFEPNIEYFDFCDNIDDYSSAPILVRYVGFQTGRESCASFNLFFKILRSFYLELNNIKHLKKDLIVDFSVEILFKIIIIDFLSKYWFLTKEEYYYLLTYFEDYVTNADSVGYKRINHHPSIRRYVRYVNKYMPDFITWEETLKHRYTLRDIPFYKFHETHRKMILEMCDCIPEVDLLTCVVLATLNKDLHGEYTYKNLFFNSIYPEDVLMNWFYSIPFYKDLRENAYPSNTKYVEL